MSFFTAHTFCVKTNNDNIDESECSSWLKPVNTTLLYLMRRTVHSPRLHWNGQYKPTFTPTNNQCYMDETTYIFSFVNVLSTNINSF